MHLVQFQLLITYYRMEMEKKVRFWHSQELMLEVHHHHYEQ